VNAIERAERDEREGDLGSARQRLRSLVSSKGYSPELCERLARLSMRMGDLAEAGRWYYLCDSSDPRAADAIERFKAACGGKLRQVRSQIPSNIRSAKPEVFPPIVRERLQKLPTHPAPNGMSESAPSSPWVGWLAFLVVFLVVGWMVIGVIASVRWIIRAFTP
jgi:hypothetical protein